MCGLEAGEMGDGACDLDAKMMESEEDDWW